MDYILVCNTWIPIRVMHPFCPADGTAHPGVTGRHVLHYFPQVSPTATLDKLKESWKLYMIECENNNSREPASTGEQNTPSVHLTAKEIDTGMFVDILKL